MKKILKSLIYPLREIKDYFFWLSVPDKELRNNGIFVEENFFDEKLCDNLVDQANTLISDKSKMLGENSWLYVRANNDEGRDTKVKQFFGFDELNDDLKQFVDSRKILNLFERKLGKKLVMRNCSMMVDEPDTETKRSFHSDNNPPASFKAFIYLTDVLSEKNGPFSVIVGTHRAHYLRAKNVISNIMNDRKVSDLETYLPKKEETAFIGKKGTAIFSTQTAFHRGNPKHSEKTRYMLVFYLSLESEGPYGEFNLGRES
jgi:hypothetical protein